MNVLTPANVLTPEELMQLAVEAASTGMADGRGGPFGAVVAKNGTVIAVGANRVVRDKDPTAHAEICAIRSACLALDTHNLSGCEIFATCEPCPMCLAAVFWARIDRVYFSATREDAAHIGFDDAEIYKEVSADMRHRKIPMIHLATEKSAHLFEVWRTMDNKVPY